MLSSKFKVMFFLLMILLPFYYSQAMKKKLNDVNPSTKEELHLLLKKIKGKPETVLFSDTDLYFPLAWQAYTESGFNPCALEFIERILADPNHLFYREAFDLYFRYAMEQKELVLIQPYVRKKGIPAGLFYSPLLEAIYLKKPLKSLDFLNGDITFVPAVAVLASSPLYHEKLRQSVVSYFISIVENSKTRENNRNNLPASIFYQMQKQTKDNFFAVYACWLEHRTPENNVMRKAIQEVQSWEEGEFLRQVCAATGKKRDFTIILLQEKEKNPALQCLYAITTKNSLGYNTVRHLIPSLENQFPLHSEERFKLLSSKFFNTAFAQPETVAKEAAYTKEFPQRYNAYLITSAILRDILEKHSLESRKILKPSIELLDPADFSDKYASAIAYLIEMLYPNETKWTNYMGKTLPLSYANLRNNGGIVSTEQEHPDYPESVSLGVKNEERKWEYYRKYDFTELMEQYLPPSHLPQKDQAYLYTFVRNFLEKTGNYYQAVKISTTIAQLLYGSSFAQTDMETLKHLYPLHYHESVNKWTAKYNVEPALVWAIMREESRYKADIVSSAAAVGLMQVMPSTAQWLAPKIGIKTSEIELTDADQNIQFGVYYLSYLQTLLNSYELIAAGYNAGQGRAKRWQYEYLQYPEKTRYEMLPIEETRHYIRKVMQSYYIYRYILSISKSQPNF